MATGAFTTALLAAALLPGAFFQWAYERNAGRYSIGLKDRFLRISGMSAVMLAVFAWPLHRLYANYWQRIVDGDSLPRLIYTIPIVYFLVPLVLGWLYGYSLKNGQAWATLLAGSGRFSTAWDYALHEREGAWIRCKLKSGVWVGGVFANKVNGTNNSKKRSYASGYPEPHELYIEPTVILDEDTGEFLFTGDKPQFGLGGLWLKGEDIAILQIIDGPEGKTGHDQ